MTQLGRMVAQLYNIPASELPQSLGAFPMGLSQIRPFLAAEAPAAHMAKHEFVVLLQRQVAQWASVVESYPADSMLHGDIFLENMIFDAQEQRLVGLIDFEEVCRGPALLDVAMTIGGCCYA